MPKRDREEAGFFVKRTRKKRGKGGSFNQRRKTLQNGIANSGELSFAKEQIAKALESLGISANIRGESLSLAEFAALSDILTDK